mmetsp:Transcript_55905/g.133239  ORF Transcript_55905/g.133239 Transcript_55905/m.133239 type:complete len:333 (+) Transcript_55905:75-1073(+)
MTSHRTQQLMLLLSWPLHVAILISAALLLEGCDIQVPRHAVGYWRQEPSHLLKHSYAVPGANDRMDGVVRLNSCSQAGVPTTLKCSGHGRCQPWRGKESQAHDTGEFSSAVVSFCKCNLFWAGPECNIPRKSQTTTFLLALILGVLGVDKFYLGFYTLGSLKLLTLGGCGFWYLFDLVQYAAGPPYTHNGIRTADDLPHWAAVLVLLAALLIGSFSVGIYSLMRHRLQRQREVICLRAEILHAKQEALDFQSTIRSAARLYYPHLEEQKKASTSSPTAQAEVEAAVPEQDDCGSAGSLLGLTNFQTRSDSWQPAGPPSEAATVPATPRSDRG